MVNIRNKLNFFVPINSYAHRVNHLVSYDVQLSVRHTVNVAVWWSSALQSVIDHAIELDSEDGL